MPRLKQVTCPQCGTEVKVDARQRIAEHHLPLYPGMLCPQSYKRAALPVKLKSETDVPGRLVDDTRAFARRN